MADPNHSSSLINRHGISSISGDGIILEGDQIRTLENTMDEEILHQSITEGNGFDSSSIVYAANTSEESVVVDSTNPGPEPVLNQNGTIDGIGRIAFVNSIAENVSNPLEPGSNLGHDTEAIIINNPKIDCVSNSDELKENMPHTHTQTHPHKIKSDLVTMNMMAINQAQTVLNGNSDSNSTYLENDHSMTKRDPMIHSVSEAQLIKTEVFEPNSSEAEADVVGTESVPINFSQIPNEAFSHVEKITAQGMPVTQNVLQTVIQQMAQQSTQEEGCVKSQEIKSEMNIQNNTVSVSLVNSNQQGTQQAPLGSSQNPIRIIQQGNRYTPMQQLTPDQLQQIMQVVRQQHVNKNTQENGGTVIFNPVTNTKIMYRVIYPSELHKAQVPETTFKVVRPSTLSQEQQTSTPQQKRQYRKRKDVSSNSVDVPGVAIDDKGGGDPELSKEEKEERKKHRPRTRSGRVSKPPKHMVQDYKQLHVLDWDEDYDDSDGGYSDFKHSDEEGHSKSRKGTEEDIEESLSLLHGKSFTFYCS